MLHTQWLCVMAGELSVLENPVLLEAFGNLCPQGDIIFIILIREQMYSEERSENLLSLKVFREVHSFYLAISPTDLLKVAIDSLRRPRLCRNARDTGRALFQHAFFMYVSRLNVICHTFTPVGKRERT